MKNVRRHVDVHILIRLISEPNSHSRAIFSEDLVAVGLRKTEDVFNKPIYVGLGVLDISKTLMYDFHYGYVLPKYGSNLKMLYTDTDSFI